MPRRWPPDWFWLLLALALRLAFAVKLGSRYHQIDELGYSIPAMRLAAEGALTPEVPAVPVLFFSLFFLAGPSLLWPRLASAFVGTGVAFLVGRMTRDLTRSENAGRLALAVSAVYPFFVYYSGILMSETLYLAFAAAGLWALALCLRERGADLGRAASAGAALGLAGLCRAEGVPIAAVILLALGAACAWGRLRVLAWALAVVCWAAPLGLWCAYNKAATGTFSLDTHGGITLLIGTAYFEENEVDTAVAMEKLKSEPFYQEVMALPPADADRAFMGRAFAFMREHPAQTLGQWGRKLVNFWRFYPRTDKPYIESAHSHPGSGLSTEALVAISLLVEPWLIVLGLWGLWRLRARREELFPLFLFVLGTMGVHMVSVSQMRYRLPVMPLLILGFAAWAASALETSRASGKKKAR